MKCPDCGAVIAPRFSLHACKAKKQRPQIILAAVEKVGNDQYELRDWKGSKVFARGTIHAVFDKAEKLWPGHVRRQNGSPGKYMILENLR